MNLNDITKLNTKKDDQIINSEVTIRVEQIRPRRFITIIKGLESIQQIDDITSFKKTLAKLFNCGCVYKKKKQYLQLQGNHSEALKSLLIKQFNIDKDSITVKGC
jgi:translation initiation factor 1 (eIF-1/SUI1)